MSTGNCFYSNIIEYGTDWGAHNNHHPQNPKYLNNMGQIVAPFPGTSRPNLFLFSKQQPHAYVVNPPPSHRHVMQNCDGYRTLNEFCLPHTHKK